MIRYYNSSRHNCRTFSVSKLLFRISRLTLIAFIAFLASSCEKGMLKNGADILPGSDFVDIKAIDTLSVFSYTMTDDSIRTDNPQISYLGQDYDPYFGSSSAGFVTQIRLTPKWDGQPYTVDSMKLFLYLLTAKGQTSDVIHTLTISEIADQIYNDSSYYSTTPVNLTGFKMTHVLLPSVRTDTTIEVKLPENGVEFGNYILHDTTKLFYNNNIPDFRSYFKGLYFQMDPSPDPLLVSLSLVYDQTAYYNYFILYVHDTTGTSKVYSFILDAKNTNASFNVFSHDYSTAILGDKMEHRNTTYKDTLSYLQSLNGVYTKVSLPGLETLKNDPTFSKAAINKARLVVPVKFNQTSTDKYISKTLPLSLRLRYRAKSGLRYDVPDYSIESTYHTFFDGRLDTVAKVYNFNIPAFVQAYLKDAAGNVKPELEIFQGAGTRNVILKANKNKTPVKLELTFTEF